MEEMREEDPDHHNHEPTDGIAGNRQSMHIRVIIPRKPVQGVLLLCLGGALGVIWRMQGTHLLQGWLDRLAIVGEQWLGGVQQETRLQVSHSGSVGAPLQCLLWGEMFMGLGPTALGSVSGGRNSSQMVAGIAIPGDGRQRSRTDADRALALCPKAPPKP
ncbi:Os01g0518200 [Oryza sativa Japonica Group]|uniref:Os01g0518200 protein n=1 Tax=Oryza sativa subsp. japonica TaxID=39947 RepID=A0A0P0V3G1_ORYSJ|nr:Os01g0518200 [Oryza sativa Japonica Group]